MSSLDSSFDEQIHASTVQFLINKNERDAAITLLACTFALDKETTWNETEGYGIYLRGPQAIYEMFLDEENALRETIKEAIGAVLPVDCYVERLVVKASLVDVAPDWQAQMLEIALGKEVHNQGIEISNRATIIWQNLRFRSESEKRIAEALDRTGTLFLPNCLARVITPEGRKRKEPDFLICHQG